MSYNLKDILDENSSTENEKLAEGIVSSLLGGVKDMLSGLVSKGEAKNADRVISLLRRLKKIGIKQVGGEDINKVIRGLEQYKQELTAGMADEEDQEELLNLIRGMSKAKPRRRQMPRRRRVRAESKYSLSAIFSENNNRNTGYMVENEPDKEYNEDDLTNPGEDETVMGNAVDDDPGLSDEEVLSGLRDDVAQYGDPDPVLDD